MPGHPADIGRAPKNIFIPDIKDIFGRRIDADEVTASCVQNSLRFPGRPARVENIKRVFGVERRWRTICIDIFQLAMPPHIATFLHVDFVSGPAKNDHMFDGRAAAERVIDIFFQWHNCAAPICAIGRDQSDGPAVGDSIANAVGAKSAEDH